MRTKKEGWNTFSNFDTIQIALDYPSRGKKTKTLQIIFGSHAKFNEDTVRKDNRDYRHFLKKFFYERSKDGYYNEKFLFIDGTPDSLEKRGHGLIFHEVFFFLEEEYYKDFVVEYFIPLFEQLNDYHKNHERIQFKKYKHLKQDRLAEHKDHDSI